MNKYQVLLEIEDLKIQFILDLIVLFSGENAEHNKQSFVNRRYENIPYNFRDLRGLQENEQALIEKLCHIIFNRGGFKPALDMLKSFKRGVKALGDNKKQYDHEKRYTLTDKDGNLKYSHKGNLPKAHFRWNYGTRYVLSSEQIDKIESLIKEL